MISKLDLKGEWKIPESDKWISGALSFDQENGAKLELFGSLKSYTLDRSTKEIILGRTDGGEITLIDNWHRQSKSNINGVTIEVYRPSIIIRRHHFNSLDGIKFNNVVFKVFNLFQWFDLTGQKNDINDSKSYTITYEEIPRIDFRLNDNCKGYVSFDGPVAFNRDYNEINLKEAAYINLNYSKQMHYKDILQDIFNFADLTTILTFEQSYPMIITFRDEAYSEEINKLYKRPKYINCIYQINKFSEKHKLRNQGEHLVRYETIKENFPDIINKWFSMYDKNNAPIRLLLNHFNKKYIFTSYKFVDIVNAVESFHRINYNNKRLPKTEFEELVSTILKQIQVDKKHNEWLKNKLIYANEPSLRNRLKELVSENQNEYLKKEIPSIGKFCTQVLDSRNYYTHYTNELKPKALKGKELSDKTRILRALLLSCILKEIGIEKENFESGLKYNLGN